MEKPPLPHNEAARLDNLHRYQILDTAPEGAFDSITSDAAKCFNVPIALVSLVDANRQWFKSCVGLEVNQTGRDESFCGHTILQSKPLIIPDAAKDTRFSDNPLVVGPPFIRFYAGVPLISDEGFALGTLCLIDREPRNLSESEIARLVRLGRQVEVRLKLRLARLELERVVNQNSQDLKLA